MSQDDLTELSLVHGHRQGIASPRPCGLQTMGERGGANIYTESGDKMSFSVFLATIDNLADVVNEQFYIKMNMSKRGSEINSQKSAG